MKKLIIIFTLFILIPVFASAESLTDYEKGELAGSLGFGAMTLDAYYEICYAQGFQADNNLNGINKILKQKWGISYSEIAKDQENKTGRNYREEARTLVNTASKETGGCGSAGMKAWFDDFSKMHEVNLEKFHSVADGSNKSTSEIIKLAIKAIKDGDIEYGQKLLMPIAESGPEGSDLVEVQYALGLLYKSGFMPDWEKAIEWLMKAAWESHPGAMYEMCKIYDQGKHAPKDQELAAHLCQDAAKKNHIEAKYYLASMYEHGEGVKQDYERAAELYLQAAGSGHPGAQYNLGVFYYDGTGVSKDHEKALYWWSEAAKGGNRSAKEWVDVLMPGLVEASQRAMERGDYEEAFGLLEATAQKGYAEAQWRLGRMYARGEHVEVDDVKAVEFFLQAARQGNMRGYELLALMYLNGRGVGQNIEKALDLFAKATALGSDKSAESLTEVYPGFELVFREPKSIYLLNRKSIGGRGRSKAYWLKKIVLASSSESPLEITRQPTDVYQYLDCSKGVFGTKQIGENVLPDALIKMNPISPGSPSEAVRNYVCDM